MATKDIRTRFSAKAICRGSQVIFGERKRLQEVLQSVKLAKMLLARKQSEARKVTELIGARTGEQNRINPAWDREFKKAQDPDTPWRQLLRLASSLPRDDDLLARVSTEHKEAPAELLEPMATHPYAAVRENVARHPNTPVAVPRRLAERPHEPLWFLAACNPSTPADLRERLRARMMDFSPP